MVGRSIKAALAAAVLLLPAPAGWLTRELNGPFPGPGGNVFFEVEKGRSARSVAAGLADRQVIRSALALRVAFSLYGSAARIKAGEYEFFFPSRPRRPCSNSTRDGYIFIPSPFPKA